MHGKRAVTVDIALRLARSFDTSEALWMGLQVDYDLEEAREGQETFWYVKRKAALTD